MRPPVVTPPESGSKMVARSGPTRAPASAPARLVSTRPLTSRQTLGYAWLCDYVQRYGYAPTLRELSAALGRPGTDAAEDLLAALERRGLVQRDPMRARAIRLLGSGRAA
jgi:hypothetical protein